MKKYIISIILMICANLIFAQIQSTIEKVTVFQSGAQVTRTAKVNLNQGVNTIKLVGISPFLTPSSIQVKGTGNFIILSVVHQLNYMNEQQKKETIINLEKQKEAFVEQIIKLQKQSEVYQKEEEMILSNKQVGSEKEGMKTADLKEIADFIRVRLSEIKFKQIEIQKSIDENNKEKRKIENQLYELNSNRQTQTGEIIITVKSSEYLTSDISISYYVMNSGWKPMYDIRVKDIDNPVSLSYKASVYQQTGEDWKDVKLTISSGNPAVSGTKQDLQTWFLNFSQPVISEITGKTPGINAQSGEGAKTVIGGKQSESAFVVSQHQYGFAFDVDIPYSIPSNGKEFTVEMKKYNVPARYEYACSPKLTTDVFLLALITGWEEYNLLDGEANIFYENTFISKSVLNVQNTNDTLKVSLGRDENIVVTRDKMKDFSSKQFIGNKQRVLLSYEINIRNKRQQMINLTLEDQIPVSTNKEIEIEDTEYPEGKINNDTGIITWKFTLKPAESKKLKLKYTVKYPKGKVLYLR